MPTLSQFHGIIIKMYFQKMEHEPPHFHVIYNEYEAEISIQTGEIIAGTLPRRISHLVKEWSEIHHTEIQEIWDSQRFNKIKPLE